MKSRTSQPSRGWDRALRVLAFVCAIIDVMAIGMGLFGYLGLFAAYLLLMPLLTPMQAWFLHEQRCKRCKGAGGVLLRVAQGGIRCPICAGLGTR